MKTASFTCLIAALSVPACENEPAPEGRNQASEAAAEAADARASTSEQARTKEPRIPVAAQFEEKAAQEIRAENLEGQLDKLEAELDQAPD